MVDLRRPGTSDLPTGTQDRRASWLSGLPWAVVLIACASLGLAPFAPMPHVVEKLAMLSRGQLVRPIDWFDLVLHGAPWALLIGKAIVAAQQRQAA